MHFLLLMPIKTAAGKVKLGLRIRKKTHRGLPSLRTVNIYYNKRIWIKQRMSNYIPYSELLSSFFILATCFVLLGSLCGMRITWMNNMSVYTFYLQGFGALTICQYTEQSATYAQSPQPVCVCGMCFYQRLDTLACGEKSAKVADWINMLWKVLDIFQCFKLFSKHAILYSC